MVRHADLSGVTDHGWNEIVVDGRGNIYVNSIDFDFMAGERAQARDHRAGHARTASVRQVADGIEFPNGMVVTPDNSTLIISESFAGRLTAFDIAADGSLSNRRVWADGRRPRRHLPGRRGRHLDALGGHPYAHRPRRQPRGRVHPGPRGRRGAANGSSSTGPASPACSAVPIGGRCS